MDITGENPEINAHPGNCCTIRIAVSDNFNLSSWRFCVRLKDSIRNAHKTASYAGYDNLDFLQSVFLSIIGEGTGFPIVEFDFFFNI